MKKKLRKQILNHYKWWDQEYLLDLMILWLENAAKQHRKHGNLVRSDDTAKKMELIVVLLKRIRDDEYYDPCKVFPCRNLLMDWEREEDYVYLNHKYSDARRKQDKDYVFKLLAKHIDQFWD